MARKGSRGKKATKKKTRPLGRKGKGKGTKRKRPSRPKGKRFDGTGCQDIQNKVLTGGFYLSRVGIKGVRKPVKVNRPKGTVTLTPTIDIFVDLPASQKGSHLSRNAEVVNHLVDKCVRRPCKSLEGLCGNLSRELLEKHGYATTAEVHMTADYFLERTSFTGHTSLEVYRLMAKAKAVHGVGGGVKVEKVIGVEVMGMTACPCAMESAKAIMEDEHEAEFPDDMPTITHNQRNITTVTIQVPEDAEVEADDLIAIIEASMSSPTFEILKREDEARLVIDAHLNPKFVEDVVRDILTSIVDRYRDLPDNVKVTVRSVAEESIHKHDAIAERVTTLGELRDRS